MADQDQVQEDEFKGTPSDWQRRWQLEFSAARKELQKWQSTGERVIKRYLDEREGEEKDQKRRNYFSANVMTQEAILFGQTPKATVSRRFADADDSIGRVAAEMLERILNTDAESTAHGHDLALENALQDFMLPGLGMVRCLYRTDFEGDDQEEATEAPEQEAAEPAEGEEGAEPAEPQKVRESEEVELAYVHWRDVLWSPCKTWHDLRWVAFRAEMSRESLIKRFGEKMGEAIPLGAKPQSEGAQQEKPHPWARAEVWEIWSKELKKRFMFCEGYGAILEEKEDPLKLKGFWPFPRPLMANLTTSKMVPRADFALSEDLYEEINEVSTRIVTLQKALTVRGAYDQSVPELAQLVNEGQANTLIPVENMPRILEKGGLSALIAWLPLEAIVAALDKLLAYREALKQELYELTGWSDIMRGQSSEEQTTATEQRIKMKFGSVRLTKRQNEFARFVTAGQAVRAEMMCAFFEPETLIERSNIMETPDKDLAQQAAQFLKANFHTFRIEVKPEAVNLADSEALKGERMEVVAAIGGLLQQAMPLFQTMPQAMPLVMEVMRWVVAACKGSAEIQGVLDRAIQQAEQAAQQQQANPQPQQPDPKLLAINAKNQGDVAKIQAQAQSEIVRINAETQALQQRGQQSAQLEVMTEAAKARIKGQLAAQTAALKPQRPPGSTQGGMP